MAVRLRLFAAALCALCVAGHAWAGAPIAVTGFFSGSPVGVGGSMTFPAQTVNTNSPTQVETVNVQMTALDGTTPVSVPPFYNTRFIGASIDNPDFAITGGTCVPGLDIANGGNCTLQLAFTPSAPGARNGVLSVQCAVIASIGVVMVSCDNLIHPFLQLAGVGSAIAAVATAVPALGAGSLTALALLLFGASILWMHRRR